MKNISLLDCTLRDGGYVNEWEFGAECIRETCRVMADAGIEIVELGFLRDAPYDPDIAIFNDMHQIAELIGDKRENTVYAVMCEAMEALPVEKISQRTDDTADVIRVIVWKSEMQKGYDYCKGIVERGYRLCVQPNRVDQYSFDELRETAELFNTLDPLGFYVVDSFGLLNCEQIMEYVEVADSALSRDVSLGYHGHNNLMQAGGTAEAFVKRETTRDIIVDASIYGIGRGAGNLNIEIFAKYLNENFGKSYNLTPMLDIWEKHLCYIREKTVWGYTMGYYLSALYRCNPMYAEYYEGEMNLPATDIDRILSSLSDIDRVIFTRDKAKAYWEKHADR